MQATIGFEILRFCGTKGKCARESIFFANRFPSPGNFVNKKVGFWKN